MVLAFFGQKPIAIVGLARIQSKMPGRYGFGYIQQPMSPPFADVNGSWCPPPYLMRASFGTCRRGGASVSNHRERNHAGRISRRPMLGDTADRRSVRGHGISDSTPSRRRTSFSCIVSDLNVLLYLYVKIRFRACRTSLMRLISSGISRINAGIESKDSAYLG